MGLVFCLAPAVFHDNQAGWLSAALADGEKGIHAQFFHLFFIKNFGLDAVVVGRHFNGLFGQPNGVTNVRWHIAQIAGVIHAAACRQAQIERFFLGFASS